MRLFFLFCSGLWFNSFILDDNLESICQYHSKFHLSFVKSDMTWKRRGVLLRPQKMPFIFFFLGQPSLSELLGFENCIFSRQTFLKLHQRGALAPPATLVKAGKIMHTREKFSVRRRRRRKSSQDYEGIGFGFARLLNWQVATREMLHQNCFEYFC